jgi:hypothetical protein
MPHTSTEALLATIEEASSLSHFSLHYDDIDPSTRDSIESKCYSGRTGRAVRTAGSYSWEEFYEGILALKMACVKGVESRRYSNVDPESYDLDWSGIHSFEFAPHDRKNPPVLELLTGLRNALEKNDNKVRCTSQTLSTLSEYLTLSFYIPIH